MTDQDTVTVTEVIEDLTAKKLAAEAEVRTYKARAERAQSEATYFRTECRRLGIDTNMIRAIEETLGRRVESLERDAMPGDRSAAAGIVEARTCLAIVRDITGRTP